MKRAVQWHRFVVWIVFNTGWTFEQVMAHTPEQLDILGFHLPEFLKGQQR